MLPGVQLRITIYYRLEYLQRYMVRKDLPITKELPAFV